MWPLFAQSLVEYSSLLTSIETTIETAWHSLPPQIRDAPAWARILAGLGVLLLVMRFVFAPRR